MNKDVKYIRNEEILHATQDILSKGIAEANSEAVCIYEYYIEMDKPGLRYSPVFQCKKGHHETLSCDNHCPDMRMSKKHEVIGQDDSWLVEGIKKGYFDLDEYLIFKLTGHKPKTQVWNVLNKHHQTILGVIEWYGNWRQYVYYPRTDTLYNGGCLTCILNFIETLNDIHYKRIQ